MPNGDSLKSARIPVRVLALVFLRLGAIGFGGPAATIAMMEEETVKRRKWLTHEQFLDLLGATNLIPGPNSTEMAIHIGYVKAGWRGLVVAGSCFIFPAVAVTLLLAYLYARYGTMPQFGPFMFGIRAGIIAIILAAVFRLSKPLLKNRPLLALGVAVMLSNLGGLDEIILLLGAGLVSIVWEQRKQMRQKAFLFFNLTMFPALVPIFTTLAREASSSSASLTSLGLFFLKIGAILYGSGYVLVAFLQGGLVEHYHWLTQQQLLDAIAIGQFTPGPVLSTATFIGYLLLGLPGATVATICIFLPSFIFVLLSSPFIPRMRRSPIARRFLDGVNAGALGLMLAVCVSLGLDSLASLSGGLIFVLAVWVLVAWNLNAAWVILGSAGLGWLFS